MNTKNQFVGVAYWTVKTDVELWVRKAAQQLAVLHDKNLAVVAFSRLPAGDAMTIEVGDYTCRLVVKRGQGQGMVDVSPVSGCFIVCLVSLSKTLGGMSIVSDAQASITARIRRTDPLYSTDWPRIQQIAQELGLICGDAFVARHTSVFTNTF